MDTANVSICYRPLRIGWAIREGDFEAFRRAVRWSHALWGGRFNPILIVDRRAEAAQLVDLFRVDMIIPVDDAPEIAAFIKTYPHLINPFFHDSIFVKRSDGYHPYSQVLDIQNALTYLQDKPEWKALKDEGVRLYQWAADDPLADVLLTQLGAYPSADEVDTDYRGMLLKSSDGTEHAVDRMAPMSADILQHPGISYLGRHALERHYGLGGGWDRPGFFVGSAASLDDLVCHWNLRACDIPLWFIDAEHADRYSVVAPAWEKTARELVAGARHEWDRRIGIWTRQEAVDTASLHIGDTPSVLYHVSDATWNGKNTMAPTMHFGETSSLGVMGSDDGRPKVSFAFQEKPFSADSWFHHQHLVASVDLISGLYGDESHSFDAPYLPELNEFFARTMHFEYNKFRVEPGRIGLVVRVTDHDDFLRALPADAAFERIFEMAGYRAKLSNAGLIVRQLIARLGGIQGARVFKVPGVRRLLRTHGPTASFTKMAAVDLIGSVDPDNPDARFGDHLDLYVEPRTSGTKLTPPAVFGHLVEQGLFRIGAELVCPSCRMTSWTPLDSLSHQVACDLCGREFNASRQLAEANQWHYRRSGILGAEKNAQGAIPVALTLQALDTALRSSIDESIYSPSLELSPLEGTNGVPCEVDFAWIIPRQYPRKTVLIVGECKDHIQITAQEIGRLRTVVDAFPRKRFKTFVVLSQLAPFTADQVEAARTLNDKYRTRAILLSAPELEPYHIYERSKVGAEIHRYAGGPEDMAAATEAMYFRKTKQADGGPATAD